MLRMKIAACALLLLAKLSFAAESDPCAATPTTSDVQLSLSLKGGQSVFRQGEVIPLVMSSTATAPHHYWANSNGFTQYCLEPIAPDPTEAHQKQRGFDGGGIFSWQELGEKPSITEAALNRRYRLGTGHYVVYVVSLAVWHPASPGEKTAPNMPEDGHISDIVRSNKVEFDVRPASSTWQHQQVEEAVATLMGHASMEDFKRAAEVLRVLDTKDSIRTLVKMLGFPRPNDWLDGELSEGLYASTHRQLAIDSMSKEMAAPETAINGNYFETLIELREDSERLDDAAGDGADPNAAQQRWKRQNERRQVLTKEAVDEAVAALPHKLGAARAITAEAVLRESEKDAALLQSLRPVLIAAWKDLPTTTQQDLIVWHWQLIDGPEMLPALRGIVAQTPPENRTASEEMRNTALRRIYEIDPEEGRRLILRDLLNTNANPTPELVKRLSPEEIAQAVPAALERIGNNQARALDFDLLDHFAGPDALGSVQAILDATVGKQACDPQAKLLRYALRVAPDYGAEQVRAAMKARKETGCYHTLLEDLREQLPAAQQTAIDALDDEDAEVERSAAIALRRWGTAEAEQPLWERMKRLHDEWVGRGQELHAPWELDSPGSNANAMEQALSSAILRGNGWMIRREDLTHLQGLLLNEYERRQIGFVDLDSEKQPIAITPVWNGDLEPTFQMLQYLDLTDEQLAAKLRQYPRGRKFNWLIWQSDQAPDPPSKAKQDAEFEKLRAVAAENGMEMVEVTQP